MPLVPESTIRAATIDAFVKAIRAVERDPWRQARLLAFVRKQRQHPGLREVAAELFAREKDTPTEARRCYWPALELLTNPTPTPPAMGPLWIEPVSGVCLVRIPPGTFMAMSEKPGEELWRNREVEITGEYWLGKYPVTNGEYGRFLAANPGVEPPGQWKIPRFNASGQPVVGVTCDEAQTFADWAGLRLPNEVEWEYACRAGMAAGCVVFDTSPEGWEWIDVAWTGTLSSYEPGKYAGFFDHGWFQHNSRQQSHPVGLKRPNGWGLHDFHGNVWEWCENLVGVLSWGCPLRGGGWDSPPWECGSANREECRPEFGRDRGNLGFRVACGPVR